MLLVPQPLPLIRGSRKNQTCRPRPYAGRGSRKGREWIMCGAGRFPGQRVAAHTRSDLARRTGGGLDGWERAAYRARMISTIPECGMAWGAIMGEWRLWTFELRYSIVQYSIIKKKGLYLLVGVNSLCLLWVFGSLSVFFVEGFWSELLMTFSVSRACMKLVISWGSPHDTPRTGKIRQNGYRGTLRVTWPRGSLDPAGEVKLKARGCFI
jgi:hypothetical protein